MKIPSFSDCEKIIEECPSFYKKEYIVDDTNVIIFNYNSFMIKPEEFEVFNAFELRGLTFIHENGEYKRYLMLPKFFNVNENIFSQFDLFKNKPILSIQEKIDGSMVRFIKIKNKVYAKTKLGLTNYQSELALILYNKNKKLKEFVNYTLNNNLAAIFELVGPSNQIVLRYDKTELFLLQVRDEISGKFLDIEDFKEYKILMSPTIKVEDDLSDIMEKVKKDTMKEGIVVRFQGDIFLKMKTDWYFEHHNIMTKDSLHTHNIIKLVINNKYDDLLSYISINDDLYNSVLKIRDLVIKVIEVESVEVEDILYKSTSLNARETAMKYRYHPLFNVIMSAKRGGGNVKDILSKYYVKINSRKEVAEKWIKSLEKKFNVGHNYT